MTSFTALERCVKLVQGLISIPLAPLSFFNVSANHVRVIQRFGKVDRVATEGLRWAPLGDSHTNVFIGPKTHNLTKMQFTEKNGTPILVNGFFNYSISDPAKFVVVANESTALLHNTVESVLRDTLRAYPFISTTEKDIRNGGNDICKDILDTGLAKDLSQTYGFRIHEIKLTEINYAPEIAQQMLLRQQAEAVISAREAIVSGAVGIIQDTVAKFPDMGSTSKNALINNLLVTLTSQKEVQPVVPMM